MDDAVLGNVERLLVHLVVAGLSDSVAVLVVTHLHTNLTETSRRIVDELEEREQFSAAGPLDGDAVRSDVEFADLGAAFVKIGFCGALARAVAERRQFLGRRKFYLRRVPDRSGGEERRVGATARLRVVLRLNVGGDLRVEARSFVPRTVAPPVAAVVEGRKRLTRSVQTVAEPYRVVRVDATVPAVGVVDDDPAVLRVHVPAGEIVALAHAKYDVSGRVLLAVAVGVKFVPTIADAVDLHLEHAAVANDVGAGLAVVRRIRVVERGVFVAAGAGVVRRAVHHHHGHRQSAHGVLVSPGDMRLALDELELRRRHQRQTQNHRLQKKRERQHRKKYRSSSHLSSSYPVLHL